jgi:hypothetical protein
MSKELSESLLAWVSAVTRATQEANPGNAREVGETFARLYDAIQNEPTDP